MKSKIIINVKKLISILLCTISISSTIPSSLLNSTAFAVNDDDITCQQYTVQNFEELQDAITHAQKGEIILLSKDITIPKDKQLCINNKDITITSYGNTKTIKLDTYHTEAIKFNFFRIEKDSKVNLENITIDLSTGTHYISTTNAINVYNSTLNINSGTTIKNFRSTNGAAIYSNHSKISLNRCNICDFGSCATAIALENKSDFKQNGGEISRCYKAISSCDSNIEQTNVTISNCNADCGGAIYSQSSNIDQKDVTISNCKADYGGAICSSDNSKIKQTNVKISDCEADYGGAIYSHDNSKIEQQTNVTISNCKAKQGGAIYSQSSKIDQKDVTISNCKAKQGGAIYSQSSKIDQKDVTISNCKADYGGALCAIYFSSTSLFNTSIDSCQAKNGGAIAAYSNSCLSLVNSKIDNCKSENENIGKGNAIYIDFNSKLEINDKSTISFDTNKCKINENHDNGEQKYQYKGIFDEKLDKNNIPKVDNNNPHPFQINSPDCYTCNNNEYNNPKRIKVFGTGTPGYIVKIYKYNALRNKDEKDIGSAKVNDKGQWSADIVADADRCYNHLYCNLRFVHQKSDNDASSTKKCQNISFWLRSKYDNNPRLYHHETENISNICIWPLFVDQIETSSPMSTFIDRECKENNHKLQEYTRNINNIIFGVVIHHIQPIIKNMEYLKTDQLYCLNKPIPKDAKWIPAPKSSYYYYCNGSAPYYNNNFSTQFQIDLEEGKLNDQFYVYCKLTDIFNNIRYARFNSHVLIHKDIEVKEDKITEANVTYKKLTKKDKEFSVTLNKNTLCEKDEIVKVIDYKTEKSLQKNTDYTIEGNKITIKQNYLDKLKDTTDNYLTIYYYPAGKTDCGKMFHPIHISTKKPKKVKVTNYEYSNSTDPTISGTGEKGCLVSITNENKEVIGTTRVAENGQWQLSTSKLPKDTKHKIFIFQTDLKANTTSDPYEYIPDNISVIENKTITHTKPITKDKPLDIKFNGNTVKEIKNKGQLLIKNKDYKISTTQIVLTSQYLNNLDNGSYNLEISFCPTGKTDIISNTATVKLNIATFQGLQTSYTYGDTPKPISLNCGGETGKVTYEIKPDPNNPDVATIDPKTGELKIKNAGKFKITATIPADKNHEKLTFESDFITVNKRKVTIEGVEAKNKRYDGTTEGYVNSSKAFIKNKVTGDDLDFKIGHAKFKDAKAGEKKTVKFYDFELTGNARKNYLLEKQPADAIARIGRIPLRVSFKIKNKLYDGNQDATFAENPFLTDWDNNPVSLIGVRLINGKPYFKSANPGKNIPIIFPSSQFSLEGDEASNYDLITPNSNRIFPPESNNICANIDPKPLQISLKVKDKPYDGNTKAEFEKTPTLQGIINNENVRLVYGNPRFQSANPGQNKHIQFSSKFKLEGKDKDNYVLDTSALKNVRANIYKLPKVEIKSLKKEDGKDYKSGEVSNQNVILSYKIEKGSFQINPKNTQIYLDGNKADANEKGIQNINCNYDNHNQTQSNHSNTLTFSFTILKEGKHKVQIEIFDDKGHSVKSTPITIKIDKSKPKPLTVTSAEYVVIKKPRIFGIGEKGCAVTIEENGKSIGTTTVKNDDGKWEFTPTSDLSEGTHTLSIFQTNQAGTKSDTIEIPIFITKVTMDIDRKWFYDNFDLNRKVRATDDTFVDIKLSTNDPSKTIKLYYLKSNKKHNLSELLKKQNWMRYQRSFSAGLRKNDKVRIENIFAKATDIDNNIHVINSDTLYFYTPL